MNAQDPGHCVKAIKDTLPPNVLGLMTMGPRFGEPENARPYFRLTKEMFDQLAAEMR